MKESRKQSRKVLVSKFIVWGQSCVVSKCRCLIVSCWKPKLCMSTWATTEVDQRMTSCGGELYPEKSTIPTNLLLDDPNQI